MLINVSKTGNKLGSLPEGWHHGENNQDFQGLGSDFSVENEKKITLFSDIVLVELSSFEILLYIYPREIQGKRSQL